MKRTTFGFLGLLVIGIVAAGAYALPFGKGMWAGDDMTQALETGDYDAYLAAMDSSNRPDAQVLTEDEFSQRSEQYREMAQQRQQVQAALESDDYGAWKGAMSARFTEDMFNRQETVQKQHDAVEQAMADDDYDAWLEAIQDTPASDRLTSVVNEGNFETYVQLHEAVQDNDWETARELQSELGLEPFQKGPGIGMFRADGRGRSGFRMSG
jgi:hypothetical protein